MMLDVAAAVAAAAERIAASVVRKTIRIADNTLHGLGQLKLVDLVLHVCHAVARDDVEDLLGLLHHIGVDSRGVERGIEVDLVDGTELLAAAFALLVHQRLLANGQRGDVALELVVLVVEGGQHVVEHLVGRGDALSADSVYRCQYLAFVGHAVLVIEAALDFIGRGEVLVANGVGKPVVTPGAVHAVHQKEQDNDHAEPAVAPAITVTIQRSDVTQRYTFHDKHPLY